MPYQYILTDLLARNEGAVGALFLDESGETIDIACADYTPYQLRVVGAYIGIYMRQLERLLEDCRLGELQVVHIAQKPLHIFALPLPERYSLVLVQRSPSLVVRARRSLEDAGEQIVQALFES